MLDLRYSQATQSQMEARFIAMIRPITGKYTLLLLVNLVITSKMIYFMTVLKERF